MQHKRLQGLCTKISQWYSQSERNDKLNRCDFRCVLNIENVWDRCIFTGRLFQARGPATARARSPMVERRVTGTRTSAVDAERSRRRESTSDSGWINSDRYCGAAPFRQRCTRTQSLYWMRSSTRSQCKVTNSGVTRSNLRASAVVDTYCDLATQPAHSHRHFVHTKTGSFQSHSHYWEEDNISFPFLCNIR